MKQLRLTTIAMLITLCLLLACDPGLPLTVIYVGNGADSGDVPVDASTYNQYDAVTVTSGQGSHVKAGYNLAGWMTALDGTGTSYAPGTVFSMKASDTTLYAVWISNDYSFRSEGTAIILSRLNTPLSGTISVPAGITDIGERIVKLGSNNAFKNYSLITSIVLPQSVQRIGSNAFAGTGVTSLTIPSGVTIIGTSAFNGCTQLATVTIMPTTPPTLGTTVFTGLPGGYQLRVPVGTVATYQAATNWITWQANIVSQ